jgi:UDP-N-acetyl-D-mannosaminuronate dehydrogenase
MGEVGRPLYRILSGAFECKAVDIRPVETTEPCAVLHICYPFQIADFVGTSLSYIQTYRPLLTIINSTVAPGTTRKIYEAAGRPSVAYSPVRGKHANMERDMLRYKKFVAGCDPDATAHAISHFSEAGFKTDTFTTPEAAELAKLLETTYLGVLIAWAQETERFGSKYNVSFNELNSFVKEIDFLPSHVFPGQIGGHCVMPNIAILQTQIKSRFLDAIVESNQTKTRQTQANVEGEEK